MRGWCPSPIDHEAEVQACTGDGFDAVDEPDFYQKQDPIGRDIATYVPHNATSFGLICTQLRLAVYDSGFGPKPSAFWRWVFNRLYILTVGHCQCFTSLGRQITCSHSG